MKQKTILACLVLFMASLFFTGCKTDEEKKKLHARDVLADLLRGADADSLTGKPTGQIVSALQVKSCFKAYDSVMKTRGFGESPNVDTPIMIKGLIKITRREEFRGQELMAFLDKAASRHETDVNNGGLHTSVQLALGIYTDSYLKYVMAIPPGSAYDSSRLNRIGVFLVTCSWDDNMKQFVPNTSKLASDDDPSAFDFGGLHP
jgi:hypothetical protein